VDGKSFLGRTAILEKLNVIKEAGKLGQPFLLVGPEGSGKENTALEFARQLNCANPAGCTPAVRCESCVKTLSFQHPDIRWIGPATAKVDDKDVRQLLDKKMANPFHQSPWSATSNVSIGDPENPGPLSIRSLIHFLRRRAFQSPYKVAVVADGQRMNHAAANAFLKTLEEPPADSVIFLLATGTDTMLPTILSRCQKIRFDPWPADELASLVEGITGTDPESALSAARTSGGNARRAVSLLDPTSQIMTGWATMLFQWIHQGNRAMAGIAADELHRGLLCHALDTDGMSAAKKFPKEAVDRRSRSIQLCELLNLHYSDAVSCAVMGEGWEPRLMEAVDTIAGIASSKETQGLLDAMASIDEARGQIDRNINIGLSMAVLFEGLIDNAQQS
jgi:DNA polymerase III delta prime subunit